MTAPKYVKLTAAADGTPVRIRCDQILGLHTADVKHSANFITGPSTPGQTVVNTSFGAFRVKETQVQVVRMMAGTPTKGTIK